MGDRSPSDPTYDWPRVFKGGDVVRLDDGRIAVVEMIMDYAPDPPAKWELIVRTISECGSLDDTITEPWLCHLAPEGVAEAEALGLRPRRS